MKDIRITKLRPLYSTVITTLDAYPEDVIKDGVVIIPAGAIKQYQTVLAVGKFVDDSIKVGDKVLINFNNFVKKMYKENSIKNDEEKMIDEPVLDIPRVFIGGKLCGKITDRDIDGVIEETEEIDFETIEQVPENSNSLLDN